MKKVYFSKLIALIVILSGVHVNAFAQTTFSTPGGPYPYTAVGTSIVVDAQGAVGGNNSGSSWPSNGGYGGRVVCTLTVVPGTTYYLYVGGAGGTGTSSSAGAGGINGGAVGGTGSGYGGGGGGGASDIRTISGDLTSRIVVAGGAGGAGLDCANSCNGGNGGATTAQNGQACGSTYTFPSGGNGQGGSTSSGTGSAPGFYSGYGTAFTGTLGVGGASITGYPGGGGGGGYWGGGGGVWMGAGGGSSYTDPTLATGVTHTQGYVTSGGGKIVITELCNAPGTISGASSVCMGSTTGLTESIPGGTWTSGTTSVATISSLGVVTPVGTGTTTITYTVLNPCGPLATKTITVNPTPTAISGTTNVCSFFTTSLSSSPGGGTWSSSNFAQASVSSTGLVTGGSAGIPTISYTLPGGCNASTPVTVNSGPAPITGNTLICGTGATTALSDISLGGTWASSFISVASISGILGTTATIMGGIPGLATISYTFPTGCFVSTTVTVNNLTTYNVTGGVRSYCFGTPSTYHIGLDGSTSGISYRLYNGASPASAYVPGTGSPLDFGIISADGTYTVIATNLSTGCSTTMSGSATITVNPLPNVYPVIFSGASSSYCAGGAGVHVLLGTGSQSGINYQLFSGSTPLTTISGTGSPLDFGARPAGIYTIVATNPLTGCTLGMAGSVTITTNPLPGVDTVTGSGSYCADGPGRHVGLNFSSPGINYTLYDGPTAIATAGGSGSGLDFGIEPAGTYTVSATNPITGCSAGMYGKAIITTTVLPDMHTVTATNDGVYCSGGTGVHVGVDVSNTGISYQLYNSGIPSGSAISGTGSALDFGLRTAGTYTVIGTNTVTGCSSPMLNSVAVNVASLPTPYPVSGGGHYCEGGIGRDIALLGSDEGVSYQLYKGATAMGPGQSGTGGLIDMGNWMPDGVYTVMGEDNFYHCKNTMTGSVVITTDPLPIIFTMTGGGGYCQGASGKHVGLSFSNVGITYQLYYNGSTLIDTPGGTGSGLDFGIQTSPGVYTAVAVNTATGCVSNMDGNAVITINPLPDNSYMVSPLSGSFCAGGTGIDITTNNSSTGINYQLYRGTTATGAALPGTGDGEDAGPLDFGLQTAAGVYTVKATNAVTGCSSQLTGSTTITVNPLPSSYVVSGGGNYCTGGSGENVIMSGSDTGISYQLYNGATPVGDPLSTLGGSVNFGTFTDAGTYTVVATNGSTSCTRNMSGSAAISILPLPGVFNVTGGGDYCMGGSGRHIGLDGSEPGIHYQLSDAGGPSGPSMTGSGLALDFGLKTTGGGYTVVAINPVTLCSSNMTSEIQITVDPLPNIYVTGGGGPYCEFGSGVDVNLSNSDGGISYQLFTGGVGGPSIVSPEGGGPLDFGSQTTAGVYTVVATNGGTSCSSNMAGSATVTVISPNAYTVIGGGGYCDGGTGVHVGLSGSGTGVNYQLYYGGSAMGDPVPGSGSALDFGLQMGAGSYTVVATDTLAGCIKNMAGSAAIIVNPLPAVHSVTGGGRYCAGGAGEAVGLAGSEEGVNYQLYRDASATGLPLTSTGGALDFGLQTTAGTYTVIATNPATTCTNNMSSSAVVTILPTPAPYHVTVDNYGNYCAADSGLHIHLPASEAGVSYQLFRDAVPVGGAHAGTGSALDFGLQVIAGAYTISAVDSSSSCANNMEGAATIFIVPLPVVHNVTGGGDYCPGGPGVSVGLDHSQEGIYYQLYRGMIPVGTPMYGTGVMLDFGLQTAGRYTVIGNSAITNCPNDMFGAAVISEDTLKLPSITIKAYPGLGVGVWHIDSMQVIFTNGGTNPTFQWVINGNVIDGATTATFTHHEFFNGDSVSVMVTAGGPCGGLTTSKGVFLHLFSVGVNQVTAVGTEVKLIPNPNKGTFSVKGTTGGGDEEITLEVTNMLGQEIYTSKVMARNGSIDGHIGLSRDLPNGMYLLNVRSATQNNVIHFVIEQ